MKNNDNMKNSDNILIFQYINFSVLYKSGTKNWYFIAVYAKPRPKYQY